MRRFGAASPAPPTTFAAQHWGRAPLLTTRRRTRRRLHRSARRRARSTSWSPDAACAPRSCAWRRTARYCPPARFTRGGGAGASIGDQAADDKVLPRWPTAPRSSSRRCTAAGRRSSSSRAELAAELGHPVQINAYITPPQNQGFAPHYDVHDVFVLQVAGRKRWTIHEPVVERPAGQPAVGEAPRGGGGAGRRGRRCSTPCSTPATRSTFRAARSMPRRRRARPRSISPSGVHPVTRYQLVRHVLELAQDDPALRASLPMGVGSGRPGRARRRAGRNGRGPARAARVTARRPTSPAGSASTSCGTPGRSRSDRSPSSPRRQRSRRPAGAIAAGAAGARRARRWRAAPRPARPHAPPPARRGRRRQDRARRGVRPDRELPGLDVDRALDLGRTLLRAGIVVPA